MKNLVEKAVAAKCHAYVPYGDFKVGAAVLADDGNIYTGCNIQNGSFGAKVCAEHTAILKAISEGARHICAIAVSGPLHDKPTYPCGICRQVICEFAVNPDIPVFVANNDGTIVTQLPFRELLPHSFDSLK